MDSINETLKRAREVQQRYKYFLERKVEQDQSIQETFKKIDRAQETLKETRETIGSIDKIYTRLEQVLSETIDNAVKNVEKYSLLNVPPAGFEPNRVNAQKVATMLKDKKKILVLTGAGMSAASGIPTFRGADGFWTKEKVEIGSKQQSEKVDPETILTLRFYKERPDFTWKWLHDFYGLKVKAKLNKGHIALNEILEELARKGKEVCMVTQNIDNFHIEAQQLSKKNSKNFKSYPIYEIHGNILKIRCDKCSLREQKLCFQPYQKFMSIIDDGKKVVCPRCESPLRPHVMFFDEAYDEIINRCETIRSFLKEADAVLVIGTALQTGLSSEIVVNACEADKQIVEINPTCEVKRSKVWWMEDKAEVVLEAIKPFILKK